MALFAGNLTRFGGGNLQETAPGNLALFRRKLSVRVTANATCTGTTIEQDQSEKNAAEGGNIYIGFAVGS